MIDLKKSLDHHGNIEKVVPGDLFVVLTKSGTNVTPTIHVSGDAWMWDNKQVTHTSDPGIVISSVPFTEWIHHIIGTRLDASLGLYPVFIITPTTCGWTPVTHVAFVQSHDASKSFFS